MQNENSTNKETDAAIKHSRVSPTGYITPLINTIQNIGLKQRGKICTKIAAKIKTLKTNTDNLQRNRILRLHDDQRALLPFRLHNFSLRIRSPFSNRHFA